MSQQHACPHAPEANSFGMTPAEVAARRDLIVEGPLALDRGPLALILGWRWSLPIEAACMALRSAPGGMDYPAAEAWAARIVTAEADSLGVTRGH
jgi:hypothetical protein